MARLRSEESESMESFIAGQIRVILQPLLEDVKQLEARVTDLKFNLGETDANLTKTHEDLQDTKFSLGDLRGKHQELNGHVEKIQESLAQNAEQDAYVRRRFEATDAFVNDLRSQLEGSEGWFHTAEDLQRRAGEAENDVHDLRKALQKTNDNIDKEVKLDLRNYGLALQQLQASHQASCADIERQRADADATGLSLQNAHHVLEKTRDDNAKLRREFIDLTAREARLGLQVQDWQGHFNKLHPVVEELRRDANFLKQRSEHHDQSILSNQRGNASTRQALDAVETTQSSLIEQLNNTDQSLAQAHQYIDDARSKLDRTASFANNLHTRLDGVHGEVQKCVSRLDENAIKHGEVRQSLQRAHDAHAELQRDHQAAVDDTASLRRTVDQTNDTLRTAQDNIGDTNGDLNSLRRELEHTNEKVARLDQGVDLCRASFAGMRKGFVLSADVTNHAKATRETTSLPQLSSEISLKQRSSPVGDTEMEVASTSASGRSSPYVGDSRPMSQQTNRPGPRLGPLRES